MKHSTRRIHPEELEHEHIASRGSPVEGVGRGDLALRSGLLGSPPYQVGHNRLPQLMSMGGVFLDLISATGYPYV